MFPFPIYVHLLHLIGRAFFQINVRSFSQPYTKAALTVRKTPILTKHKAFVITMSFSHVGGNLFCLNGEYDHLSKSCRNGTNSLGVN